MGITLDKIGKIANAAASTITLIELVGSIGSGKTTLVKQLQSFLEDAGTDIGKKISKAVKPIFLYEEIEDKDCKSAIKHFYEGTKRPSDLESVIVGTRIQRLIDAINSAPRNSIIISDRSIEEDLMFINKLEKSLVSDPCGVEKEKLNDVRKSISDFMGNLSCRLRKSAKVFLDVPPESCIARIASRGRKEEKYLNEESVKELTYPKDTCDFIIKKAEHFRSQSLCMILLNIITFVGNFVESKFRPRGSNPKLTMPQLLVSLYGVPGVGKTHIVEAMEDIVEITQYSYTRKDARVPNNIDVIPTVKDNSDSCDRIRMMKAAYTGEDPKENFKYLQKAIDEDRIKSFEEIKNSFLIFTDVGRYTGRIFAEANGKQNEKPLVEYSKKIGGKFPPSRSFDFIIFDKFDKVEDRIKRRGRPGEDVGLNRGYLCKIASVTDRIVKNASAKEFNEDPLYILNLILTGIFIKIFEK